MTEFSFRTRKENLARLENEEFDFLVIGGESRVPVWHGMQHLVVTK
jgi:hypothetical protein